MHECFAVRTSLCAYPCKSCSTRPVQAALYEPAPATQRNCEFCSGCLLRHWRSRRGRYSPNSKVEHGRCETWQRRGPCRRRRIRQTSSRCGCSCQLLGCRHKTDENTHGRYKYPEVICDTFVFCRLPFGFDSTQRVSTHATPAHTPHLPAAAFSAAALSAAFPLAYTAFTAAFEPNTGRRLGLAPKVCA